MNKFERTVSHMPENDDLPTLCRRYPRVKQLYQLAQTYNQIQPKSRCTHQAFFTAHHQPHPLWQLARFMAPDQDPDHYYEYAVGLVPVWADNYDLAIQTRRKHDPRADLNLVLHRWEFFQDSLLSAYPLALTTTVLA